MFDPSSFADPTPLAHADASRDVFPRGDTSQRRWPTLQIYSGVIVLNWSELLILVAGTPLRALSDTWPVDGGCCCGGVISI
ncbi:hypothetical protein TNCV_2474051 [Trichonephila clavipes]|nr:hypothetical protein TNCV_2474051 [Trichonephila clavipes]